MQLLLNKSREFVATQHFRADMGGSFDLSQAPTASAETLEGLHHVPLGRRIEKRHFIPFCNLFECYYFHPVRIEEHIGITTVIDVLKMLWLQHDVLVYIYLYRKVRGLRLYFPCSKISYYIPRFIRTLSEESFLIVSYI
jgi:hypothetical protein